MGIINVTPDSFSDGGRFYESSAAVDHGLRLVEEGADLLDVGGESTRPYSTPVPVQEELRRVVPVVQALVERSGVPVSIDTSKAAVAREALAAGAEVVNDVTALRGDPEMLPLLLQERPGLCLMHMQGTPQNMQDDPRYEDVVAEVYAWLEDRLRSVLEAGLEQERVALDPGIGFGKTHQHNLELLAHCGRLHALGCALLVGHSRKGFIGHVLQDRQCDRTFGTIGVALALALQGVQVLRVHDVLAVRQALMLFEASGGLASIDLAEALSDTPRD
jgi:dihydropteroate synthase